MKPILAASFIALFPLTSAPLIASEDAHTKCANTADYAGCMKFHSGSSEGEDNYLSKLRNSMKQVASRLQSGTSLRDASATFQPVIDAAAIVPSNSHDSYNYLEAQRAIKLFDITKATWAYRIQSGRRVLNNFGDVIISDTDVCANYYALTEQYNEIAGETAADFTYSNRGGFAGPVCKPSTTRPENSMYYHTIKVLRAGAEDPKVIAAREEEAKRQRELCMMEPWSRYLAENPSMAAWAKQNPSLAEKKKKEVIENSSAPSTCN